MLQDTYIVASKNNNPISFIVDSNYFSKNQNDDITNCFSVYYTTSLIGSKNLTIFPIQASGTPTNYTIYPYVVLDSRWYFFKYNENDEDNPSVLPPNCFLKTFSTKPDGTYTIEWRNLTSDGTVFIKASLYSNEFWNGIRFVSDEEAEFDSVDTSQIQHDMIIMKTRSFIDIIRNPIETTSLSIFYKKYIDECIQQTLFLFKRIRGSYCISVNEQPVSNNNPKNTLLKVEHSGKCANGCISCWELIRSPYINTFKNLFQNHTKEELFDYFLSFYDTKITNNQDWTWLESFLYNIVIGQKYLDYNLKPNIISDHKLITIEFKKFSERQNKFFGIEPQSGIRKHHKLPFVQHNASNSFSSTYSYYNLFSLQHQTFQVNNKIYPSLHSKLTEEITQNRIKDGKERVVVPPGVIFTTLKALPGIIDLYGLDSVYTRPDELHFAVDEYGNILGYKNLPYPGLLEIHPPVESVHTNTTIDHNIITKVHTAWNNFQQNNYTQFDENDINDIYQIKIQNNYFVTSRYNLLNDQREKLDVINNYLIIHSATPDNTNSLTSYNIPENIIYAEKTEDYILGGYNPFTNQYLNTTFVVNTTTNTLNHKAHMSEKRCWFGAIRFIKSGKMYIFVAGGYNDAQGSLDTCEIYDESNNQWSPAAPMNFKRTKTKLLLITLNSKDYIVAVGGYEEKIDKCGNKIKHYHSKIELYDFDNDEWIVFPHFELVEPREDFHFYLIPQFFIPNSQVKAIIIGGFNGRNILKTCELLNFSNNTISTLNLNVERRYCTVNYALNTNSYYIIGGLTNTGPTQKAERFDCLTETLQPISDVPIPVFGHDASTVSNSFNFTIPSYGQSIIIAGGSDGSQFLKSIYVYNTNNNVWYPLEKTLSKKMFMGYVIYKNNNIYFLGGLSNEHYIDTNLHQEKVHTYMNIHHCPIWVEKDIFASYLITENPVYYGKNHYDICLEKICTNDEENPPNIPELNPPKKDPVWKDIVIIDEIIEKNEVHGFVDIKINGLYTFEVPQGVSVIKVQMWGAGGGGGGYAEVNYTNINGENLIIKSSGGGGGGGGHIMFHQKVVPGTTIPFKVGKGGKTGCSIRIFGKQTHTTTLWFDDQQKLLTTDVIPYIVADKGENGEESIFGSYTTNSPTSIVALGGQGAQGGFASLSDMSGGAGIGGEGSSGGYVPPNTTLQHTIYKGINGLNGKTLKEGTKGPAQTGGSNSLFEIPYGGSSGIEGAGKGGDGNYSIPDIHISPNGEDGRVIIIW